MTIDVLQGRGLEHLPRFMTNLAVGLLIGLERERSSAARAGLNLFTRRFASSAAQSNKYSAPAVQCETGVTVLTQQQHHLRQSHLQLCFEGVGRVDHKHATGWQAWANHFAISIGRELTGFDG